MNQPLEQLRVLMKERSMDAYLIPSSDYHQSEYFDAHFETTRFLSHFSGEACTLVITPDQALLWTDGRFFVQAEEQMDTENFQLCRMGMEGVPTVEEYLAQALPEGGCLGFDGRIISIRYLHKLEEMLKGKNVRLAWEEDLVDQVWTDRPALKPQPAFVHELNYAGKSREEKLAELRAEMKKLGATAHILTSLDDEAWLFNIRGNDVPCTPLVFSYTVVTEEETHLFLYPEALTETVQKSLDESHVVLHDYSDIYDFLETLPRDAAVLVDEKRVNMALAGHLPESCRLISGDNPTTLAKAIKNDTEIKNLIHCHIKDGVAMVRFMRWLKSHIGKEPMTEISASDVLEQYRREQNENLGLSFSTIAGYGPHGAMMHYMAVPETDAELHPEGFLLVDSGGQYMDGTTDITRTFVLGPISQEQKQHFTAVARGMLNLANARFLEGCCGLNLDYLAREPMWELGIDYRCGTGHGVGYLLSVHEGPQSFRWKERPGEKLCPLVPGMVITDEPGIYLDYRYGIRTENELLCVRDEKNEYGQFLRFRNITYCPIDLDGIDTQYMSPREIRYLNDYHSMVYETLRDYLTPDEAEWLKEATRPVGLEK